MIMRRKKTIPASIREQVITRDNGRCRACGIGDRDSLQCDHIVPESKGGTDSLDNLQALCPLCNNRKQNTDIGELPILPPLSMADGFGNPIDVMHRRGVFVRMLEDARQNEIRSLAEMVASMRASGVDGFKIRKHLGKMVKAGTVERILKMSRT